MSKRSRRSDRTRRSPLKILLTFLLVILVIIVGGTLFVYNQYNSGLKAKDAESEEVIEVEIPQGVSTREIALILEENDIIQDDLHFNIYSRLNEKGNYQAGYYLLSPSQSVEEIAQSLVEGGSDFSVDELELITFPEGINILEVVDIISKQLEVSEEEVLETMEDPELHASLLKAFPELLTETMEKKDETYYTLEGYLYPSSYNYQKDTTPADLIYQMVETMDLQLREQDIYNIVNNRGLSLHDVLALSSFIEEEASNDKDRRMISSVFHNRLDIDMMLQTDVTVSYANGEHLEFVTLEDAGVDSPYNLYRHTGLGPGPINNSSVNSVVAALDPAETDYIYFLADIETGKTYFSHTFEEHLEKQAMYVNKTVPIPENSESFTEE